MTTKEIVSKVWKTIFPIAKLEAVGTIQKEIAEATNTSILELWAKIKPLFIEEFEAIQKDPTDEDIQAAARVKIRQALENDDNLKKEITDLLAKTEKGNTSKSGMHINNQGATITNQTNIQENHGDLNF